MPFGDLTVSEGRVIRWLRDQGEAVVAGETLVEVETAKALVEIESPGTGTLRRIIALPGSTVRMGERLGLVGPPG